MNSTHKVAGSNPAGDATPCDHVVGHDWEGEEIGEVFFTASDYEKEHGIRPSLPLLDSRQFKFCPECGACLAEFWKKYGSE